MTFPNTTAANFFDAQSNGRASSSPFVDVFKSRDPTTRDVTSETSINNYAIQQKWLNTTTQTLWELKNFTSSQGVTSANWIKIGGSNIVETLTGNDGIIVPPTANNINVVGDGTFIKTVGNAATSTLTIQPAGGLATVYTENTGTAVPSSGNLNVLGTLGITTVGSGNTITIETNGTIATSYVENSGTAIPSGGILNVLGAGGVTTSGSGNTITINGPTALDFSTKNQVFTGSGTYTPTTGMLFCQITSLGGGGGGGGAVVAGAGEFSSGGGGGAGEYAVGIFSAATIGASQTVTIGAAGTGAVGAAGTNGGNTSVGALITTFGGSGAVAGTLSTAGNTFLSPGGAGGTGGAGGDYRSPGFPGINGMSSATGLICYGGTGASSQLGSGALEAVGFHAGSNALGYGAGGGGANQGNGAAFAGGNGSAGIVVIQEYIQN